MVVQKSNVGHISKTFYVWCWSYSGHIRPLKDKKGLAPNSSWVLYTKMVVRSKRLGVTGCALQINVERSTWKYQRGKINVERSTWKYQRGKINVERSTWKDKSRKINVERSTWKDQRGKVNMIISTWKDRRGKINVERSTWEDQRGKINVFPFTERVFK